MKNIIEVSNLGKKYILGQHLKENNLREALTRKVLKILHKNAASAVSQEFWALRNLSFSLNPGERLGIIGRNGAGKSTALKLISRITEPTEGRIILRGRVASLLEVGTGFHGELTGKENIFLNGSILGMTKSEIKNRFDEIVDFSGVEKFLDTPVKRYSSGMYVRLAFAVAAHLEPEILIVDEVLAVGDAEFQKKCLSKMQDASKSEGKTVIFVSHNMTAIENLCEKGILLDQGRIVEMGEISEVIKSYMANNQAKSKQVIRERKDREGNGEIRITGMKYGTFENPSLECWITGKNSYIDLEYESIDNRVHNNVEVSINIVDMNQRPLIYLGTKIVLKNFDNVQNKGIFRCSIPRLPLEPGQYNILVEIMEKRTLVDLVDNAFLLTVETGDYYGSGIIWKRGGVLFDYDWEHINNFQ